MTYDFSKQIMVIFLILGVLKRSKKVSFFTTLIESDGS